MYLLSSVNTHHDVINFGVVGMVEIQIIEYLEKGERFFHENKNITQLYLGTLFSKIHIF